MVFCQDSVRRLSYQSFDNESCRQEGGQGSAFSGDGESVYYSCAGDVAESVYSQQADQGLPVQQKNFVYFCNYALSPEKYLHRFQDRIHPIQSAILPCFKLCQCSQNGCVSKDNVHALKRFFIDMSTQNFDDIKLATYRTAAKLFFVIKCTNLHMVDIYNIIEAFRENGLHTLGHTEEIDQPRLESIVQSIYFTLYKRLPSTEDFDLERCIVLLTQWIMHAYDSGGTGRIQVLSVKTALSALCEGRLIDKFRYVFTQISNDDGLLNAEKFDQYLKQLLVLPSAVREEPNFGYSTSIMDQFFNSKNKQRGNTKLDDFLNELLNMKDNQTGILHWLHMLDKLSKATSVTHNTQCKACLTQGFSGLRYKCAVCYNYNICQECFLREKVSVMKTSHKAGHDMKEYLTWGNKSEKGTSVKKKLLGGGGVKLPDYAKEPEPDKMLDMSNIVPAAPSAPPTPCSTLGRASTRMQFSGTGSLSMRSNASNASSLNRSRKLSQENIRKQDDEHRLISLYAQRLAVNKLNTNLAKVNASDTNTFIQPSQEEREMLTNLEEKNRTLLQEIQQLKAEHEEATKNAEQMEVDQTTVDPNLLSELRVLRQRKDELEMRMSKLQETRRDLMGQLEGLMKLLKNTEANHVEPQEM